MSQKVEPKRIGATIVALLGLLLLRVFVWFIDPLLPVLVVLAAMVIIYRVIFRKRFFWLEHHVCTESCKNYHDGAAPAWSKARNGAAP